MADSESNNPAETPTCFVIMPFRVRDPELSRYQNDDKHWYEVFQGLIVPAIEAAGLRPLRDDEDYTTRLVAEGIWSKIESADIVLCDLSSHNPNVHLELGWALRSDKKLVLIKDDLTEFSFDLNQYTTFHYSHRLQPVTLKSAISELGAAIKSTHGAGNEHYSVLSKMALMERANVAAQGGDIQVRLMTELLAEIRSYVRQPESDRPDVAVLPTVTLGVTHPSQLAALIIGTTWRKKNGLEEVFFESPDSFKYTSVGNLHWTTNNYRIDNASSLMELEWASDGFKARCRFDQAYSTFVEANSERWYLIARTPYIHPSFGKAR